MLSKTIKDNRNKYASIPRAIYELTSVLDYQDLSALNRVNFDICFLSESEINTDDLYSHLKLCLESNPSIFSKETKQEVKTNLRRLIRIYDWLIYGNK